MKVSMRSDYGIRALVDLALHYGLGAVQSRDIAVRQGVPESYLDQLMTVLRKAGLIRSTRGPQGGHVLARPPTEITIADTVLALEGSLAPIDCLESEQCPQPDCIQREVWQRVQVATQDILRSITIADLAERQRSAPAVARYYI
ncbi:MAG: Rrf2 family transcriptional regulator [Chloroflexi bacterium]|nr:Rrf2 family transcriptional regulator [Chloroflexota bacterium]